MTYTIDSTVLSSVKLDDKGNFLGVSGAYRATDIQVNGQPLDLNRTYTASHNYMLKSAGDSMTIFKDAKILKDEVMTDVDVLSDYINTHLGGNVGAEYAEPGRPGAYCHQVEVRKIRLHDKRRVKHDGSSFTRLFIFRRI